MRYESSTQFVAYEFSDLVLMKDFQLLAGGLRLQEIAGSGDDFMICSTWLGVEPRQYLHALSAPSEDQLAKQQLEGVGGGI